MKRGKKAKPLTARIGIRRFVISTIIPRIDFIYERLYIPDTLHDLFFSFYQEGKGSSIGSFKIDIEDYDKDAAMLSFIFDIDSLLALPDPTLLFTSTGDKAYRELWKIIENSFTFRLEEFWLSNIVFAVDISCGNCQTMIKMKRKIQGEIESNNKDLHKDNSIVYLMDNDTYDTDTFSKLYSIPSEEPSKPSFVRFCFSPDSKELSKYMQNHNVKKDSAKKQLDTVLDDMSPLVLPKLEEYHFYYDILKDITIENIGQLQSDNLPDDEMQKNNAEETHE